MAFLILLSGPVEFIWFIRFAANFQARCAGIETIMRLSCRWASHRAGIGNQRGTQSPPIVKLWAKFLILCLPKASHRKLFHEHPFNNCITMNSSVSAAAASLQKQMWLRSRNTACWCAGTADTLCGCISSAHITRRIPISYSDRPASPPCV